jgi:hypothetical protein
MKETDKIIAEFMQAVALRLIEIEKRISALEKASEKRARRDSEDTGGQ